MSKKLPHYDLQRADAANHHYLRVSIEQWPAPAGEAFGLLGRNDITELLTVVLP